MDSATSPEPETPYRILVKRLTDLEHEVARLRSRLQGVIENHHLWDGS